MVTTGFAWCVSRYSQQLALLRKRGIRYAEANATGLPDLRVFHPIDGPHFFRICLPHFANSALSQVTRLSPLVRCIAPCAGLPGTAVCFVARLAPGSPLHSFPRLF